MTTTPLTLDPIKTKHRAMWALGNYDNVATEVIQSLGTRIVEAAGIAPGDRVLDVAAGSGNASLPAARAGGQVWATDITPELLETGRQRAEAEGLDITWREADAEHLPCEDGEYDVGPLARRRHVRAVPPAGGRRAPAGDPTRRHHRPRQLDTRGVHRPDVRGDEAVCGGSPARGLARTVVGQRDPRPRALRRRRVSSLTATREELDVDRFTTGAEFRDFFKTYYGPTIAAYRNIADDPARVAELDQVLADLGDRYLQDGHMPWEYLLVTATRA